MGAPEPSGPAPPLAGPAAHPVTGTDVVLGQRGGGAHGEVEGARGRRPATRADVRSASTSSRTPCPARRACAPRAARRCQRDPPVDPAQPVADCERSDARELAAVAGAARLVRSDQAGGCGACARMSNPAAAGSTRGPAGERRRTPAPAGPRAGRATAGADATASPARGLRSRRSCVSSSGRRGSRRPVCRSTATWAALSTVRVTCSRPAARRAGPSPRCAAPRAGLGSRGPPPAGAGARRAVDAARGRARRRRATAPRAPRGRPAEHDRDDGAPRARRERTHQRLRGAPALGHGSSARGVATCCSTSVTTLVPVDRGHPEVRLDRDPVRRGRRRRPPSRPRGRRSRGPG